jgi:hypothetical protein
VGVMRASIDFLPFSSPDFSASCTAFSIARCAVTPGMRQEPADLDIEQIFVHWHLRLSSVRPKDRKAHQTNLHCSFVLPYEPMRREPTSKGAALIRPLAVAASIFTVIYHILKDGTM